jgi:putative Mg2+ transporter-C (MgtC) family protein
MPDPINTASALDQVLFAGRVAIAGVCGAAVGWERWMAGKFAGIRTHAIVAIASGLACATTQLLVGDNAEAARILAAIFTGVGFIGAGAILQTKRQMLGITTSATVLLSATIGATAGLGLPVLAAIATVGSVLALRLFGWIYFRTGEFDTETESDPKPSTQSGDGG